MSTCSAVRTYVGAGQSGHHMLHALQGSGERFLDGDTQYSTEYESGTESREAVNDRIEPYPGDLSKVSTGVSVCLCVCAPGATLEAGNSGYFVGG